MAHSSSPSTRGALPPGAHPPLSPRRRTANGPRDALARIAAIGLSLAAMAGTSASEPGDWPEFRGPNGDGTVPPTTADGEPRRLPTRWSEESNIRWKTAIHHSGWSTPLVGGGRIWLTTATEDGHDMFALCIDAESGRILHDIKLFHNDAPEPLGNPLNGYASPSGVLDGERVFLHFGSYGTACLDAESGEVIWERRDLPCRHFRGPGSSLVEWKDTLILTMDGVDVQYLAALDKTTGKTVWKSDRTTAWDDLEPDGSIKADGDFRKAYTTPLIIESPTGPQLVSCGAKAAFGYDPDSGSELWTLTYPGFSNASRPVAGAGLLFVNTGFSKASLLGVRIDESMRGDITGSHVVWQNDKRAPLKPSPVFVDGLLFAVNDGGIVSCFDPASGEEIWSERLAGKFSASPIAAGGVIYCPNEDNTTYVVRASRTFEVISENGLDDGMLASPAVVGNDLVLRTRTHLYRVSSDAR